MIYLTNKCKGALLQAPRTLQVGSGPVDPALWELEVDPLVVALDERDGLDGRGLATERHNAVLDLGEAVDAAQGVDGVVPNTPVVGVGGPLEVHTVRTVVGDLPEQASLALQNERVIRGDTDCRVVDELDARTAARLVVRARDQHHNHDGHGDHAQDAAEYNLASHNYPLEAGIAHGGATELCSHVQFKPRRLPW